MDSDSSGPHPPRRRKTATNLSGILGNTPPPKRLRQYASPRHRSSPSEVDNSSKLEGNMYDQSAMDSNDRKGKEKARALSSAKRARGRPKGSKNKPKNAPDMTFNSEDDIPPAAQSTKVRTNPKPDPPTDEIVFDQYWTVRDEEELQNSWTERENKLAREISLEERKLWKRSFELFGVNPWSLLPNGVSILVEEKEDGSSGLNWGIRVSREFAKLLCCPAFEGKLWFLQYALKFALWQRAGETHGHPEPAIEEVYDPNAARLVVTKIEDIVGFTLADGWDKKVIAAIEEVWGPKYPEHFGFIKAIKSTAKPNHKVTDNPESLKRADIVAVCEAWDIYAAARNRPTIADATDAFNKRHPTHGRRKAQESDAAIIHESRKQYMLQCWREEGREMNIDNRGGTLSPINHFVNSRNTSHQSQLNIGHIEKAHPRPMQIVNDKDHVVSHWKSIKGKRPVVEDDEDTTTEPPQKKTRGAADIREHETRRVLIDLISP